MPISGLVVTLSDDAALQRAALAGLREHPALELGERSINQVPVVVESAGEEEDRLIWEWLHALPGVAMVVVAFIHFDEDSADGAVSHSSLDRTL
jgi:hypothetical protein